VYVTDTLVVNSGFAILKLNDKPQITNQLTIIILLTRGVLLVQYAVWSDVGHALPTDVLARFEFRSTSIPRSCVLDACGNNSQGCVISLASYLGG